MELGICFAIEIFNYKLTRGLIQTGRFKSDRKRLAS